jgi:hypothetical protein
MLIDINVMEPEQINLYYNFEILTVGSCQNLTALIKYYSKINQSFKRSVKIKRRIKLKSNLLMNVPIQIKNNQSFSTNRFLIFELSYNGSAKRLIQRNGIIYAYIMNAKTKFIQIRNDSSKSFVLPHYFYIGYFVEYIEKNYFNVQSEAHDLTAKTFIKILTVNGS